MTNIRRIKPLPLPEYTENTGRIKPVRKTPSERLLDIYTFYSPGHLQKALSIPASTITRIQTGQFKPSKTTVDRLFRYDKSFRGKELYRRARESGLSSREAGRLRKWNSDRAGKYIKLRSSGDSVDQAKGYSLTDRRYVNARSNRLLEVAKKLSKKHNVKLEHIIRGMQYSDRTVKEWEIYISERRNKK
jgi:hypothetical protein